MLPMLVTPEVSQLDMSALKLRLFQQSPPISVMAETSQSAMGPYVAVALVELALNSWTAFCRAALVVKILGGGGVVGGGEGGADGGGGNHCGTALKAKSIGNHCGGTALLSDWRAAWAVELGLDEIHGLMVLVPVVPRPCQLERGVVRRPGWKAVKHSGCMAWLDECKRQARVARCRGV